MRVNINANLSLQVTVKYGGPGLTRRKGPDRSRGTCDSIDALPRTNMESASSISSSCATSAWGSNIERSSLVMSGTFSPYTDIWEESQVCAACDVTPVTHCHLAHRLSVVCYKMCALSACQLLTSWRILVLRPLETPRRAANLPAPDSVHHDQCSSENLR